MAPSLCVQFRPRRDQLTSSSASIAHPRLPTDLLKSNGHVLERTDCGWDPGKDQAVRTELRGRRDGGLTDLDREKVLRRATAGRSKEPEGGLDLLVQHQGTHDQRS